MGDRESRDYGLRIFTDSYTIKEVITLMNVLSIRYNINCKLFMNKIPTGLKPRIIIPSSELNKLRQIVLPYFTPEMKYKIESINNLK
jgi:hypothetical protein